MDYLGCHIGGTGHHLESLGHLKQDWEIPTWDKQIMHIRERAYAGVGKLRSAGPVQKWPPFLMVEYRLCVDKYPFFKKEAETPHFDTNTSSL